MRLLRDIELQTLGLAPLGQQASGKNYQLVFFTWCQFHGFPYVLQILGIVALRLQTAGLSNDQAAEKYCLAISDELPK